MPALNDGGTRGVARSNRLTFDDNTTSCDVITTLGNVISGISAISATVSFFTGAVVVISVFSGFGGADIDTWMGREMLSPFTFVSAIISHELFTIVVSVVSFGICSTFSGIEIFSTSM